MKTKIYMLTVILGLSIPLLYAGDPLIPVTKAVSKPADISFSVAHLAPVTPAEADFEDSEIDTIKTMVILAPVTPKTAEFNDDREEGTQTVITRK